MCQTDRPEDQAIAAPVDAAAEDTGQWPVPQIGDADAARSDHPEPEIATAVTDQVEAASIARQDRGEPQTGQPPESLDGSTPRIIAAIGQLAALVENRLAGLQTLFDREIRARHPASGSSIDCTPSSRSTSKTCC